jgi:hypothetical protein
MDVHQQIKRTVGVIAAATLLAVNATANATPPYSKVDFQVVHFPHGPLSAQPAFFAIRTETEWLDWWNARLSGQQPNKEPEQSPPNEALVALRVPPKIDFDHSTLVVASLGAKMGTGHSVYIAWVTERPEAVEVGVNETNINGKCTILTAVSIPAALALIPKTDKPIRFRLSTVKGDCPTIKTIDSNTPE